MSQLVGGVSVVGGASVVRGVVVGVVVVLGSNVVGHISKVETHSWQKQYWKYMYCKLGNFGKNFTFANGVKRHICDVYNSRLGHDLPISVNNRVILHMRSFAKMKPLQKFLNLQ